MVSRPIVGPQLHRKCWRRTAHEARSDVRGRALPQAGPAAPHRLLEVHAVERYDEVVAPATGREWARVGHLGHLHVLVGEVPEHVPTSRLRPCLLRLRGLEWALRSVIVGSCRWFMVIPMSAR